MVLEICDQESEAWGIDLHSLTQMEQRVWFAQERFLAGYKETGTANAGLARAGVVRRTFEGWKERDQLRFRDRLLSAHETFSDSQEERLYTYNAGLKPGQNPTGLLASLNANRPAKWRPNVPITVNLPNDVIRQLGQLQELVKALPQGAVVGETVEGEARELSDGPMPWDDPGRA